ncbi:MAG: CRISPR system precrRNA processing endoribonuclease RAMP protein Cas6, partial [Halodesulfurarchaeum sp.]
PVERFPVPQSDGYPVYSALLSVLGSVDEAVGDRVHDSAIGSIHTSGLQGVFGESDVPHHKSVEPARTYDLELGIVDPDDHPIFQALVNALVLDGEGLELTKGQLAVESFESQHTTHQALLERAAAVHDPTVAVDFRTATCIEEAGDVTTMFPHRVPVFRSLLGKWNRTAPEEITFDVGRDTIAASVIEKPDPRSYDTHSVLVNRVENEEGETRNIFRQGFTGECSYAFKDATEAVENALTAAALFGEYSGVGSAVSRGCGSVAVEVVGESVNKG